MPLGTRHPSATKLAGSARACIRFAVFGAAALVALMLASPAGAVSTFTVNRTSDQSDANPTDNACDVTPEIFRDQCTLRAAIEQANATPNSGGPDFIRFQIGGPVEVKTISPGAGGLPTVTEAVTIDGYTQTGASENTLAKGTNAVPLIALSGAGATGATSGLNVGAGPTTIRGLIINDFPGAGIALTGGSGNVVEGNFIGTDALGTAAIGNGNGVSASVPLNSIGGAALGARNLISGNGANGIDLDSSQNTVERNLIGTAKNGTSELGNAFNGVSVGSFGSPASATRNVINSNLISANGRAGVALESNQNTVERNLIGTGKNGTGNLGNSGGGIQVAASFNLIERNTVAFNGDDTPPGLRGITGPFPGISVLDPGVLNRIVTNSIFGNAELGIDLDFPFGPTPNDPQDADSGPNNLQNFPVITSAVTSASATTIEGKLNSTPSKRFLIEVFSNPSGNEAKTFLAKRTITTNTQGNKRFTITAPLTTAGDNVTATATTDDDLPPTRGDAAVVGDTSEISKPRTITAAP